MSLLAEINSLLEALGTPVETGVFSSTAPDEYLVVTPLGEIYELYSDNRPSYETQEARLSLYSKTGYIKLKNRIVRALLSADYTISDRRYIGYDDTAGYHQYAIDVAKHYQFEEDV